MSNYVLGPDGEPVLEPDTMAWARWFGNAAARVLAKTEVGDMQVSTIFLGIDHAFMGGPPILWETPIFGGQFDQQHQWRYRTRTEAQRGHTAIVDALEHGEKPPGELCGGVLILAVDGERREAPCRLPYGHEGNHKAAVTGR